MDGNYCVYLRKSRADESAPDSSVEETLSRHEKTLLSLGKQMNLNITKIYREVVSGDTIASRPMVQELLADVEAGLWDGVLVMEIERLARGDTIDQGIISQTFKYSDTKIITPIKTYNPNNEFDEEYFEFGLFMSRREYKVINRRLQRGRLASVKEGKYVGNVAPYGYRRIPVLNGKGYTLEPLESEADVVKLIFDMYTNGVVNENAQRERIGASKICKQLKQLGIKSRKNDFWSPETIKGILHNPVYIGKIRWNARAHVSKMVNGVKVNSRPRNKDCITTDGLHPPIISLDTWNRAQYYISQNSAAPIGKRGLSNPLAGLIVCGVCGHRMMRRPYGGKTPDGLICVRPECANIGSELKLVEDKVLSLLADWLKDYKLNLSSKEDRALDESYIYEKRISEIDAEISTLNKQTNSLYDLLEQGVYTSEIFIERSKILADQLAELKNSRALLKEKIEKYTALNIGNDEFIPRIENLIEAYNGVDDIETKNQMLKEVITKIVYIKRNKGSRKCKDNFELVIYPKLANTKITSQK